MKTIMSGIAVLAGAMGFVAGAAAGNSSLAPLTPAVVDTGTHVELGAAAGIPESLGGTPPVLANSLQNYAYFNVMLAESQPYIAPDNYHGSTFNDAPVGMGNNTIFGGTGNDTYFLSNGDNWLDAGGGNDYIHAGTGNNTIYTGTGDCVVYGGGGTNFINLETGNNYVVLQGGNNIVVADSGDNVTLFVRVRSEAANDFEWRKQA